jgi:glyoxylase-like metal-dependent hydrolase (beta-lactamase superfamily II)
MPQRHQRQHKKALELSAPFAHNGGGQDSIRLIMMQWQVGEVLITKLTELETEIDGGVPGGMLPDATVERVRGIDWLRPDYATEAGRLKMSVHALLVQTPTMRLVIDTCIGNDKPRKSPMFDMLQTDFLQRLEQAGWTRESVDGVLCTHLHVDHVGWNTMLVDGQWQPTFPRARYYMGRIEYDHWLQSSTRPDTRAIMQDSVEPVVDAGLASFVEVDQRICEEIRLIPSPGHTPGHVCVVIESQGQRALITGDCMHHPVQIAHPEWSSDFDSDKDASRSTRTDLIGRLADTPTLLIGTHFSGRSGGRVLREGPAYRFAPDNGLSGSS